jgi:hypothetical protein
MIQDKIFFDEKDPTGLSYNTPFTVFGSYEGRLWSKTPSGEIKYYTQNSDLSVYATTGSNSFNGNQTVTGSLTVTEGITGTATTASYVEYTGVANKPTLVSSSAQIVEYNVFATTGSNQFDGSQAVTGSLTVTGQVVAQTLNVQQVTSSIVFSSGSNVFGNSLANTQQFTGSVSVTGSLTTSIAAFGSAATTFLTSDSGTIKSRTAAQTLSDIAALPLAGGTLSGALNGTSASFSGNVSLNLPSIGGTRELQFPYFNATNAKTIIRATGTSDFRQHLDILMNTAQSDSAPIQVVRISNSGTATFSSSVTAASGINAIGQEKAFSWQRTTGTPSDVYSLNANSSRAYLQNDTTSNILMVWQEGGNVGIGTVTPQAQLDISTTVSATGAILRLSNQSNSILADQPHGTIQFFSGDNSTPADSVVSSIISAQATTSPNQAYLSFLTGNNTEKMRIDSSGNVGIGINSPAAKLHTEVPVESPATGAVALIVKTSNGANDIFRWFDGSTQLGVFKNNGNVGIGTDTPNALLDVDGDALINDLTVGRGAGNISTNTALGSDALSSNTTGNENVAVGRLALEDNTTGSDNVAVGRGALANNTTASNNTAVGYNALLVNTTGEGNVAVGGNTLLDNTTGRDNTAIGYAAGLNLTTGGNNTLLGHNAGRTNSPSGNITTQSNIVCLGDDNITDLYCEDTTISSSDTRDKTDVKDFTHGLDWVTQLRPVTYRWDKRSWYVDNDATAEDVLNAQPDGSKKRSKLHLGLLAQEELEVEKQFGFGETKDDMLIANLNEDESRYGIKYERLVPVLVNAIKELNGLVQAQQAKIESLEAILQRNNIS